MNKKYVAPSMTDNSVYLINGIAGNQINLGSGRGGDGKPDGPGEDGEWEGGAKERYDDNANYGNIW